MRRTAAGIVSLMLCASACSHGSGSANRPVVSPAVGNPAGSSTVNMVTVLADAGVATVANATATTPEAPVTGTRVFTLTAWQVANLSVELTAKNGISASDLNAMLPSPPHYPRFADIIGGWVIAKNDPDAVEAGRLLGPQDWSQPAGVVVPTAVTTLFMADLLQHITPMASPSPTGSTSGALYDGPSMVTVRSAAVLDGIVEAPCTTVANFVNNVLDQVFNLLKLDPGAVAQFVNGAAGGGTVGAIAGGVAGFLAGFWNHVVDLAEQSVQSLIQAVEQPVLNAMSIAIGAVAVFTMIRSYLKPWTTTVSPDPASNSFPLAPSRNPGAFTVMINRNAEVEAWPPQLVDCAIHAHITLPTLAKEGAPVIWDVRGKEPGLVTTGLTRGVLNKQFTQTLNYTTGNETPLDRQHAVVVTPTVTATVSVRRTEVEELRNLVTSFLTGKVPKLIAPFVNPVLTSYIELATEYLDILTAVTGSATIVVSHHAPKPPPPCTSDAGIVQAGHYATSIRASLRSHLHVSSEIPASGTGTLTMTGDVDLTSDGTTVTGTLTLSGGGGSGVALHGVQVGTDSSHGTLNGTISGTAAHPEVSGTLSGIDQVAGHTAATFHVPLPLSHVDCTSITSNVTDLFTEVLAAYHLTNNVKLTGTGIWTAARTG
jgi:hypothetical protein